MIVADILWALSLLAILAVVVFLVGVLVQWLVAVGREVVAEARYRLAWRRYEKGTRG